jgi:hypothetical protein
MINNERRTAPYAPRRTSVQPARWLDVLGAFAIALAVAYVLSVAMQAIQ